MVGIIVRRLRNQPFLTGLPLLAYVGASPQQPRKRKRQVYEEEDSDASEQESDDDMDLDVTDMAWALGDGGPTGAPRSLGAHTYMCPIYMHACTID